MKNRALLFVSAFAAVFASVFFYVHSVSADYGLSATAGAAGLSQEKDVAGIIGNVIGAGLSLVTVLFFILMIYGGIRWMMARGKEEESKKALDTIIAAIIGIIIVLASYAITNFVFKSVGTAAGGGGTPTPTAPKDPQTPTPTPTPTPEKPEGLVFPGTYCMTGCSATKPDLPDSCKAISVASDDELTENLIEYECTDHLSEPGPCPATCPN